MHQVNTTSSCTQLTVSTSHLHFVRDRTSDQQSQRHANGIRCSSDPANYSTSSPTCCGFYFSTACFSTSFAEALRIAVVMRDFLSIYLNRTIYLSRTIFSASFQSIHSFISWLKKIYLFICLVFLSCSELASSRVVPMHFNHAVHVACPSIYNWSIARPSRVGFDCFELNML
jgi:hypothetical protein